MAITPEQQAKVERQRKRTPPTYFNASTGNAEVISAATEAALILAGSSVKQKAVQYLDLLLNANPTSSDHDAVMARASEKQFSNASMVIADLEDVASKVEGFRDNIMGSGSLDSVYVDGLYPLMLSITGGVKSVLNRLENARMISKVNKASKNKYAGKITDFQRKEWRSWKRVLLVYS